MTFTNSEIKTMYMGLRSLKYKVTDDKEVMEKQLPLIPSVRVERMLSDLEDLFESVNDKEEAKQDELEELQEDLIERADDEDDDLTEEEADEMYEDAVEEANEEIEKLHEQEVEVEFSDPLTEEDITRLDEASDDYNSATASAVDLILTDVIE